MICDTFFILNNIVGSEIITFLYALQGGLLEYTHYNKLDKPLLYMISSIVCSMK